METRLGSGVDRYLLVLAIVLCVGLSSISRDVSAGQGPLDGKTFEAVTTSPTKGKMTWKGTVTGGKIDVSYVWVDASHWYKPNPKPQEKWAKGELKKPE
jgi:hypothetical protein